MKIVAASILFYIALIIACFVVGLLLVTAGDIGRIAMLFAILVRTLPDGFAGMAIVLAMLTPLAVVYGLRKAARAHGLLAAGQRSTVSQSSRMLVFPMIVAITGGLAAVHFGWIFGGSLYGLSLYTGNGFLDFFLWIALSFGNLMVFLFFVSIPYVMGSLLAVVLVLSGYEGSSGALQTGQDEMTGGGEP